ncbi:glycoside hydrolase family 5 protein [Trematosphaeria pertusa]|uniref:Glycoside hydrolase family 5 protein n=1 Tax=Trematosphaeria pertusa TaxID=390896 RepID=A0A6A6IEP4_9PLEO|nr:glycoside hydrolase family 5 protein [Trematosphaeria pertusa]KAF2249054.1 glycoside hydrolase family 5 protein [Trematosphaeria pertusa]
MKGLLKKAKAEFDKLTDSDSQSHQQPQPQLPPRPSGKPSYSPGQQQTHYRGMDQDQPSTIREPSALDILRYRYHHGTNLGSVYVLERWLFPSRFPDGASGSSELAAVTAWVERIGVEATKAKFEEAWSNAVTDEDIQWLTNEAKCTTIRLPIGYFDLPGTEFTRSTPFEPFAQVYAAAWASIRTLISRLRAHSIGVLLDLHALPGGANAQEHSGTNSGTAGFWNSQGNRDLGIRCCEFIAVEASSGLDIVGIQTVNEAEWESERMYEWYDDCIAAISAIDPSIPVIVSDAWNLPKAVDYCMKKNIAYPSRPTCPVLIDTHYYWAFTDADKRKTPQQIIQEASKKLTELDGKEGSVLDRGAVQALVGEYSCVLTEDSWSKAGDTPRADLVRQFGNAQSRRYQLRAGGAFFWTWKMDWMPGGEWGFKAQASSGAIMPSVNATIPERDIYNLLERARHRRDERMYAAVDQHVSYWDHTAPNMPAEHWRYENGWKVGYQDAYVFFEGRGTQAVGQGNKIGNMEMWVLKRVRESGMRGGFVWEWEQGLRRGIRDFEGVVGI